MITIQINKLKYNINLVDANNGNLLVDDTYRCGSCFPSGGEIYIHNDLSYEVVRRTIMHELTHAYIFAYGHAKREKYYAEDLCEFMSTFAGSIVYDTDAVMKHYEIIKEEEER